MFANNILSALCIGIVASSIAVSPARAIDAPTLRIGTGAAVTPAAAASYYGAATVHTKSHAALPDRAPEVKDLARALGANRLAASDYADAVHEYMLNAIETVPLFGSKKGALGTLVDRSGTPFDQAILMVELLSEGGVTASYRYGDITLTAAQVANWFNLETAGQAVSAEVVADFLADAGIPHSVSGSSITLSHIWVGATLEGTTYLFDPSYKTYQYTADTLNLTSVMGYSRAGFTSSASAGSVSGSVSGIPTLQKANYAGIVSQLKTYAGSLLNWIRTSSPVANMDDLLGGRKLINQIKPAGGWRNTSLPYVTTTRATWTASAGVPNQFRTTLRVLMTDQFLRQSGGVTSAITMFDQLLYTDDVYGRRLVVEANPDLNTFGLQFKAGHVTLQSFMRNEDGATEPLHPANRDNATVVLTVDHPYAAASGQYLDKSVTFKTDYLYSFTILNGFGPFSEQMRSKQLAEVYGQRPITPVQSWAEDDGSTPDMQVLPFMSEHSKTQLAVGWLSQFTRLSDLQARVGKAAVVHHHSVGLAFSGTEVNTACRPGVGLNCFQLRRNNQNIVPGQDAVMMSVDTAISVRSKTGDAAVRRAVGQSIAVTAAALEGSQLEQQMDKVDVASTAERFEWGNATRAGQTGTERGERLMGLVTSPTQVSDARTLLRGAPLYENDGFYSVVIEGYLGPGPSRAVSNTEIIEAAYQRGHATIAFKPDGSEFAHVVDNSHFSNLKGSGAAPSTKEGAEYDPKKAADILKDTFEDRSSQYGVSLANGQYSYSPGPDITVGSGEFPYALSFERTFSGGQSKSYGMADGWTHNWDVSAELSGSGDEPLGKTNVQAAVSSLAAFAVIQDLAVADPNGLATNVYSALAAHWWKDYLTYNAITVRAGKTVEQFVRIPTAGSDEWIPPVGSSSKITVSGGRVIAGPDSGSYIRYYEYAGMGLTWQSSQGETITFTVRRRPKPLTSCNHYSGKCFAPGGAQYESGYFLPTTWTFPQGVSLTFSGTNYLTGVSNSLGRQLTFGYVDSGSGWSGFGTHELRTVSDGTGRQVSLAYSYLARSPVPGGVGNWEPARRLSAVSLPDGGIYNFAYTGFDGAPTGYPTDQSPLLTPLLREVFDPLAMTLAESIRKPALRLDYDRTWRVSQYSDAVATRGERAATGIYVADGWHGERVDALGQSYHVYYDDEGRAFRFVDEGGAVYLADYDSWNRVVSRTYPEGNQALFTYDARSNVLSLRKVAKPGSGLADIVVSATYPATCASPVTCNKPTSVTDARGNTTNLSYHPTTGLLTQALRPASGAGALGSVRPQYDFSYTFAGLVATATVKIDGATSVVTANTYNGNGELIGTRVDSGGLNLQTCYEVDNRGNRTATIDPRANCTPGTTGAGTPYRTTTSYDVAGRPQTVIDPLGKQAVTAYDANGRAIREAKQVATQWMVNCTAYSPTGQKLQVVGPFLTAASTTCPSASDNAVPVVDTSYDGLDRMVLETRRQAAGQTDRVTRTEYLANGKVSKVIKAYGTSLQQDYATYTYTPNGQQASVKDANGNLAALTYDGHDRLANWFFPSKTTPGQVSTTDYEAYGYDASGNRTSLRKRDGSVIGYTYDALDRMTLKDLPGTANDVTYDYDLRGLQTSAVFTATGQGLASVYDKAGRLTSATSFGRTLTSLYDAASNRTRVTFPDALYVQYDYDALGRVSMIRENGAASGLGVLATYAYDDLSRRVTVTHGNGVVTSHTYEGDGLPDTLVHNAAGTAHDVTFGFDYNRVNQMTSRSISNGLYVWDGAYNANRSYTVNGLNQYVTAGPRAFSYDANGNLTSDGVWTFGFDTENRWVSATGGGAAVNLAYDPAGRLRQLTADGTATQFLYDGDALVAEYNGSGTLLRRYVHGPNTDEPVVWYEGSSTADRRWLLADHQGSIIGQANSSGVVTQTYTYGPYGEPNATSGSRFRYTGQIIIPEVGLYHYKARAYSPYLGRFLQTDPVGYEDQINLYAYVGNDPVNATDPSGEVGLLGAVIGVAIEGANQMASPSARAGYAQGFNALKSGDVKGAFTATKGNLAKLGVAAALGATGANAAKAFTTAATSAAAAVGAEVTIGAVVGGAQNAINTAIDGGSASDIAKAGAIGAVAGGTGAGAARPLSNSVANSAAQQVMSRNANDATAGAKAFTASIANDAAKSAGTTAGALAGAAGAESIQKGIECSSGSGRC